MRFDAVRNHELMQEKLGKMTRVSADDFSHRHVRIAGKKNREWMVVLDDVILMEPARE